MWTFATCRFADDAANSRLGLGFVRAPIGRRESDSPKVGRGRIEFHGNLKTIRCFARGTCDFAGDAFFRIRVFQDDPGVERQIAVHNNQCTVMIDAERGDFERFRPALQRDVNLGADAEQDTLAAAPVFVHDSPTG